MISWIQRTFQQHFKTIFAVLLGITIISFIFTIGAPGIGRADRQVASRPFFGLNLAAQDDLQRLLNDAALSINLQVGYMGLESAQLQEYALQRYAALHLADELHVPKPTDAELTEFLKTLRAFSGEDGQFDAKRYSTFRDSLKTNPSLNEGTVHRVLTDDWRTDRVQKLLGGPGYVLPSDVKQQMSQADSSWTLGVATVDYSSFDPGVKPDEAALAKYFEENSFRYEVPPRVNASYVDFSSAGFTAQVTVTPEEVKAFYDANPSRFPKPVVAPVDPKIPAVAAVTADPAADFAAVRPQVESALKAERAQRLALKAASDFSLALYEGKVTPDSPAFADLVARSKTAVKPLAPFTRENGPAELGGSPQIAEEAFKLGQPPQSYFTDALPTPTGAAVLIWKETLPSRKPLLAEVHDRVATDYVENEKRKRFVELGRTLHSQIEARLKAGDAFDKAAAASAPVKIEAKTLAPFTRRQPPADVDYSVMGTLERLEKGQLSDMVVTKDKGYFVYAIDKKVPEFSDTNPQYTATRTQLATYNARVNANAYLSEIVAQELKKSEPAAP